MLPTAITLSNYRSFASPVRLELRRLTLLFGDNNSGKSALLRALPLLSPSGPSQFDAPLDLENPVLRGSSFQDLLWEDVKDDEDPDLGIGLCWEDTEAVERIEYRLHWFDAWRRVVVRRFSIWKRGGHLALEADWIPMPEERTSPELAYEVRTSKSESPDLQKLAFLGLLPASSSPELSPLLDSVGAQMDSIKDIQWLMATRRLPNRIYTYWGSPRWMKPDGSDAPSVLSGSPESFEEVSAWYERNLRRRLRFQEISQGRFRLMLQHIDRAALDTDLVENGEGTIQVLPVLTALALTLQEKGPPILAIEEPESHLHPSLQRALAEHICDVAAESPSSRIVLETHSEHLLLGVQIQILRGRLRPDDVLVYWVHQIENGESVADPVTFDENARPQGGWPPGVFSEDTEMAREIVEARRGRARA